MKLLPISLAAGTTLLCSLIYCWPPEGVQSQVSAPPVAPAVQGGEELLVEKSELRQRDFEETEDSPVAVVLGDAPADAIVEAAPSGMTTTMVGDLDDATPDLSRKPRLAKANPTIAYPLVFAAGLAVNGFSPSTGAGPLDPLTDRVTVAEQETFERLQDEFIDDLGGPAADPKTPSYPNLWLAARKKSDARFKLFNGRIAYIQRNLAAGQRAVREAGE